jgi:hypothetical protein
MERAKRLGTHCPVCGLDLGYEPWGESGTLPTFDICDCCGIEFGYEDARDTGVIRARNSWLEAGCPWRGDPERRPASWSPEEQVRDALQVLWPKG